MKLVLLVGAFLVVSALAQESAPPTNQPTKPSKATKAPRATKPPKPSPAISCENITHYSPSTCCPSFPRIDGREITNCGRQCSNQSVNGDIVCCISNCTLNKVKGINADGSFNTSAIVAFFVKYSRSKNKTSYASLVTSVVQNCSAAITSNSSGCPAAALASCVYRQLFLQCPDMKSTSLCKSLSSAAQNCTGYPFVTPRERPKNSTKPNNNKNNAKSNDKKNKNQGINVPKDQNNTTINPTATNGSTTAPNKAQKAKASEITPQQGGPQASTPGTGSSTHKSESKDGALGVKGPGFRP